MHGRYSCICIRICVLAFALMILGSVRGPEYAEREMEMDKQDTSAAGLKNDEDKMDLTQVKRHESRNVNSAERSLPLEHLCLCV